jgi:hypothetical protein
VNSRSLHSCSVIDKQDTDLSLALSPSFLMQLNGTVRLQHLNVIVQGLPYALEIQAFRDVEYSIPLGIKTVYKAGQTI